MTDEEKAAREEAARDPVKAADIAWMTHVGALSNLHPAEECEGYICKICKALTELTYQRPRNRKKD